MAAFLVHSKRANTAKQKQGVRIARVVKWEPVQPVLSSLSHSLWYNEGGPDIAAINSPGGTTCSATDSPRGPHVLHGQSGGGGTTFRGDQLKYDRPPWKAICKISANLFSETLRVG